MPDIKLRGTTIEYELRYRRRSKHIRISISPKGGLQVSSPYGVPRMFINRALRERTTWILQNLRASARVQEKGSSFWKDGALLPYLDDVLLLQVLQGNGPAETRYEHGGLQITLPEDITDEEDPSDNTVRSLALGWYGQRALTYLPERVGELGAEMGLAPSRITIRQQRSRWGSCSSAGTLSLNMRLMLTPSAVVDYVLIHELAHLRELNHSPRFWRIVEEFCPDMDRHRDWLREQSWLLEA